MGIRIQKFLGYGLDDVAYEKKGWRLTDPRINQESFLIKYTSDEPSLGDYVAYLADKGEKYNIERMLLTNEGADQKYGRLSSCAAYSPEYGEANALVVRPVSYPDWARSDDSIDYVTEADLSPAGPVNRVERLRFGVYPWNGLYMDSRTGKQLEPDAIHWVRIMNHNQGKELNEEEIAFMDNIAVVAGFESHAEAVKHIAPVIPEPIIDLCRFAKLFHEDETIYQLRPMLYTYWS